MDSFLGEIRIFPFTFAPVNWAFCNGQGLPIRQNAALYSVLGVTFGGNGTTTFNLPNIQGQAVLHSGQGPGLSSYGQGQTGGTETVTLNASQAPSHNHNLSGTSAPARGTQPAGQSLGTYRGAVYQASNASLGAMNAGTLPSVGTGGAHNNIMPYVAMNFCISLLGEYPERP